MTRENRIRTALASLNPSLCDVKNVSAKHHGHSGDDGSGETHYQVHIKSSAFEGLRAVDRQRLVMNLLTEEFKSGLHALELKCEC